MLKRNISYEDFDGNQQTGVYYFNLSQPELVELELSYEGGFGGFMERIIEAKDIKSLIGEFKRIILMSYGIREGERFIKTEELRTAFTQTPAYDALFMELATNDQAAATFIEAIIPKAMLDAVKADQAKAQQLPPPPPVQ